MRVASTSRSIGLVTKSVMPAARAPAGKPRARGEPENRDRRGRRLRAQLTAERRARRRPSRGRSARGAASRAAPRVTRSRGGRDHDGLEPEVLEHAAERTREPGLGHNHERRRLPRDCLRLPALLPRREDRRGAFRASRRRCLSSAAGVPGLGLELVRGGDAGDRARVGVLVAAGRRPRPRPCRALLRAAASARSRAISARVRSISWANSQLPTSTRDVVVVHLGEALRRRRRAASRRPRLRIVIVPDRAARVRKGSWPRQHAELALAPGQHDGRRPGVRAKAWPSGVTTVSAIGHLFP